MLQINITMEDEYSTKHEAGGASKREDVAYTRVGTEDTRGTASGDKMAAENPEERASCLSRFFFWWVVGVLREFGNPDHTLSAATLCPPLNCDASEKMHTSMDRRWKQTQERGSSLFRCLVVTLGKSAAIFIPAALIYTCCFLVQPFLIGEVVRYLTDPTSMPPYQAYLMGAGVIAVSVVYSISNALAFHPTYRMGMRARATLAALVYNKVLTLPAYRLEQIGSGHIINLLSTDLEEFCKGVQFAALCLTGPLATIALCGLIINELKLSSLPAVLLICFIIGLSLAFAKATSSLRKKIAHETDKRVQLTNEVISAMSVVKSFAWEGKFSKEIGSIRRQELFQLWLRSLITAFNLISFMNYHILITCLTLVMYVETGGTLSIDLVIRLYGWTLALNWNLNNFIMISMHMASGYRSILRIQEFVNLPDTEVSNGCSKNLVLKDLTANWSTEALEGEKIKDEFSLRNLNFNSAGHHVIMIAGPVGSGKTSFLLSILNELHTHSGVMIRPARVSYANQESWIYSGSIRDNILFGGKMDKERYKQILESCCLVEDLESFPLGDLTEVGQRGQKLSGGQKARVCIARATYRQCDAYLYDDPLSSVDHKVGQSMMDKCILSMNQGCLKVLVTNNARVLHSADYIIVMSQGRIVAAGNYSEVQTSEYLDSLTLSGKQGNSDSVGEDMTFNDTILETEDTNEEEEEQISEKYSSTNVQLWEYLKPGRLVLLIFFFCFLIVYQVVSYGINWWLTEWCNSDQLALHSNISMEGNYTALDTSTNRHYMNIYIMMVFGCIILAALAVFILTFHMIYVSKSLHNRLLRAIMSAPISYFDNTSAGRIVNHFSRDLGFIDIHIPPNFMDCTIDAVRSAGALIFACVVNPWTVILVIPYLLFLTFVRWFSVRGGKQYKSMEAICKSPTFSHFSNTLTGHNVIRAFENQEMFMNRFHQLQDRHTSAWSMYICIYRWMELFVMLMSSVVLAILLILGFVTSHSGVKGGLIGFSLLQIINCMESLSWVILTAAEMEAQLVSVGRILTCTETPPEDYKEDSSPEQEVFPNKGAITMENVTLQYNKDTELVLKDISVCISPGEKIGIVGRTGAGKSSLFRAILRLVQPGGRVCIDGVNTADISLLTLRSNITSVTQGALLFTGSLRRNLDPFSEYNDADLWVALAKVQMKEYVSSLPEVLETDVGERGAIFSAGQKQLVCLARALLRNNKIILIDEATAHVDPNTDRVVQTCIKDHFTDCTTLTIAHRIDTVMDSDRIMVLDKGILEECDTPKNLLDNPKSLFHDFVNREN